MKFWLGTHMIAQKWWDAEIPLFVSRRRLIKYKKMPRARVGWALDSGGFSELDMHHEWVTTEDEYVASVALYEQEIGLLEWVAPQDWMCEPHMLHKTGLTIEEHQRRTVKSFLSLRERLGALVVPVLQGLALEDYLRCWESYEKAGVDLEREPIVGLGSVCRRQNMAEAGLIIRALQPLDLHGFGVKLGGLESYGDILHSADSMAWSYRARRDHPLKGCTHKQCQNCLRYATRWYEEFLQRQGQMRLEFAA